MRAERVAVGFDDAQLAIGGIAEQLRGIESDGHIIRLEGMQHLVIRMLLAGRSGVPQVRNGQPLGGGRAHVRSWWVNSRCTL